MVFEEDSEEKIKEELGVCSSRTGEESISIDDDFWSFEELAPEAKLIIAIIQRALSDLRGDIQRNKMDAAYWLFSPESDFVFYQELLGLSEENVRIIRQLAKAIIDEEDDSEPSTFSYYIKMLEGL